MADSDARKTPWFMDLTAAELEEAMAMWPLLLEVAKAPSEDAQCKALDALDAAFPTWRTWLTVEHHGRR